MSRRVRRWVTYGSILAGSAVVGYVLPVWAWRAPKPAVASVKPAVTAPISMSVAVPPPAAGPESTELRALLATAQGDRLRRSPKEIMTPSSPAATSSAWLDGLKKPSIPVLAKPRVESHVRYFSEDPEGRKIFSTWLKRRGRYRALVLDALRERLLPDDIEAVALIESGFSPTATSSVGAAGLWQLMPETARAYGLSVEENYDERRSVVRSTQAAVRHLADLHEKFGSWELTFAAYDLGYGGLLRRIRDLATNDYWTMSEVDGALPAETLDYVPKVQAAAIILRNLEHFGFSSVLAEAPVSAVELEVQPGTPLSLLARASGTSLKKLRELNPDLLAPSTPDRAKTILIPAEGRARAETMLPRLMDKSAGDGASADASFDWGTDELPKRRPGDDGDGSAAFVYYRVGEKESLDTVADSFGVTRQSIVSSNHLDPDAKLQKGMLLKIRPASSSFDRMVRRRAESRLDDGNHTDPHSADDAGGKGPNPSRSKRR